MPPYIYVGPIAELLRSRCVLLLTTRGRQTGVPRTTAVSFMPVGDHFVVFSGFRGVSSNWYRNIRANPNVQIRVGRQEMRATARLVEDPSHRVDLMRQMAARSSGCGPPKPMRPLLKLTGIFDYDGEIGLALNAGGTLPVIEITPV
jgi:deazaflavin-dependent oxidoreductase (nitroreductase family)